MAFDPNLYAIQLEMSIDATASFEALNELERKVINVEESLNRAMNATLAQTATQITQINTQLNMSTVAATDFGVQQSLNIEKFNDYTKDNLKYTDEMKKQLDLYKEIKDLYAEQNEAFQLSKEIQESIDKTLKGQAKTFVDMTSNSAKAYAGFETGQKIVRENGEEVEHTTISHSKFETALHKINSAFQKLSNTVQSYWVYFLKLTEATERFITVNNRAYGSMHEIVGQTHLTAQTYGLLHDSVLKATEALINVGASQESLETLVVGITQVNRITGLTTESLAEYVKNLESSGPAAGRFEKNMQHIIAAQRAFSLSASSVQKALDLQLASFSKVVGLMGDEAAARLTKTLLVLTAMARDAGIAGDVIEDFNDKLTATGEDLLELHAKMGTNPFAGDEQTREDLLNFYDRYAKKLESSGAEGTQAYKAMHTQMSIMLKGMGFNMKQVDEIVRLRRNESMAGKSAVEIYALYAARMKEGKDINGEYLTSMEGLVAQWNILREAVWNALGPIINWIADGMWPWIRAANMLIQVMVGVAKAILKVYNLFELWIPGLKQARGVVQVLIGGLVLLTGGLVILTAGIAAVVIGLFSFITAMVLAGSTLLGLGGAIGTFFTGAAVSINTFLTRVAAGLARLGAMLSPLIGPMLAFGAAILMVGAGIFLLAKAFEAVAQYGWQGVAMFTVFMTVVALFGLAIVGLGYLSIAAAPGLLVLGAAILMIGAGVALMVGSVALLVMAFTGLLNAITPDIQDRVIGLANGLLYLAASGPMIAFGLGVIGVSLAAVMIPLGLASIALLAIGAALAMIANFKTPAVGQELSKLADEILSASGKLTEAGLALTPAAVALIAGSYALMGSALTLALASGIMLVASTLLIVSGSLFMVGSGLFFAGATMFRTGADFVLAGANTLMDGAKLIPVAAGLLILASIDLLAAGLLLLPGSIALAASAGYLAIAGVALALATPFLMSGAIGFYFAASAMSKGIEKLEKSSIILYRFAIAARTLERLSFSGMRQGINDLGSSASEIDKYVNDMEKASLSLQNVRFDVTGFSNSIVAAADVLIVAVEKLQIPIDKLSLNINEMVAQIDKLVAQEARVNELGSNLSSAMPDKPEDLQQPAEFKKADGNMEVVNNIIEVKNDSSEMVLLLKRLVALAEGNKEEGREMAQLGGFMSSSAPNNRLRNIGIDI